MLFGDKYFTWFVDFNWIVERVDVLGERLFSWRAQTAETNCVKATTLSFFNINSIFKLFRERYKKMDELQTIYLATNKLIPYKGNARQHTHDDIEREI